MSNIKTCATCRNSVQRSESNKSRFGNREHILECCINDRTPYKLPGETCKKWEEEQ